MKSEVSRNARGWISLKTGFNRYDRYTVEELADGTIILRPVILVTPATASAMNHPAARQAMEKDSGGVASGSAPPAF